MYVKQIIIQGFKSYKDQTVIEPFSPRHNVIVGRNGSGKSNFFAAIRFVLGDAYTHMGREERQALLHEGSGSAVMSAYVEIIFDNADERFPTGRKEVILRRTIGTKKDEYTLDRKNATKADVMNLLESAGFSRANPYYIVPQGRVTTITNMRDSERLSLLKEVAGTQVYETRRAESLKIMSDTTNKRAKIDESMDYINERLAELEEEKDELKSFQEKDRERRCLEYTIYSREQYEIQAALDTIDSKRSAGVEDADASRDRLTQGEAEVARIETDVSQRTQQIELLRLEKQQLEDDRRETQRTAAQAELQAKSAAESMSSSETARARRHSDRRAVESSISEKEAALAQILPRFHAARQEETRVRTALTETETARQRLYAKQGRNSRFKSKGERDKWLRSEIQATTASLQSVEGVRDQTQRDLQQLQSDIAALEPEIEQLKAQLDGRGDAHQSLEDALAAAREERDRLMDQRKELWREEAKLDSMVGSATQEAERAERTLAHTMDHATSRGIASVRRIKREHGLDGVYGTLAELMDVHERFRTAVEVTAGQSLFHYVVDTDETATRVLEILQREHGGRVTFMPLNRLRPKAANIPRASDTIPMIERIQFDQRFFKAFDHVFGRTIICPNLQVAAQYARSHGINAITPEGDRSDKRGALTGGFHDSRHSRLEAMKAVTRWRDELERKRQRGAEIRAELDRLDQLVTRAVGELQKLEQRKQQFASSSGPLRGELRIKRETLRKKRDTLESKRQSLANNELSIKMLAEQAAAYEAELASKFEKALTADEEAQLDSHNAAAQQLRTQLAQLSAQRSELEGQKSVLEVELRENLRPRLEQLLSVELDAGEEETSAADLKASQREIKRLTKALEKLGKRLQQIDATVEAEEAAVAELEARKAEVRRALDDLARSIEKQQRRMEKSMQKKAALNKQAAECSANIRDLGVLPEEAFTKYKNTDSDTVVRKLHKVNEALKQFSHVNKQAFEQYSGFTKKRAALIQRREELETSQRSIEELISVLDQRKDAAIELTFKQVSREFTRVFEKLVPAGRGRLVIQRRADRTRNGDGDGDASDSEDEASRSSVENYIGVGISVSFNSKHDEQQRIQQLSGGQKSLCALALVFAIQACDPAPFYLFDEIDANLDAQYRTAVAQMLKSISEETDGQFICTTFRPEMLHVAEKCYGVSFRNKTSTIDVVSKEEALKHIGLRLPPGRQA
ncbi:Structural maintenance of chromosomes protein 3 [Ascosphaera acerosa]|nr:Structural maintenance of chromosomes protein 3 [Ascosphaera acerosa]